MTKRFIILSLVLFTMVAIAPTFARADQSSGATSTLSTATVSSTVLVCMQTAVNKRETAVGAAFSAYSAAQSAALTTRQSGLNAAWTQTTVKAIKTAVAAAWKTYGANHRAAVSTHNTAVKATWKQFRADAKVCKPTRGLPIDNLNGNGNLVQ